ncbi:MAG TPA: phytoene desaturase family protein [Jatrophihabitantaceae bacterium]|nr:phytoene desaturase family protein [Jatrophihabitantaceae bacterium]
MRTVRGATDRIVIVGAGLGGLSAALHLAGAGRQVTVLERAGVPGGRCGLLREAGYAFDTGPTVLTMPALVEECFASVGESMPDWLTLHRLDPAYRACFADGSSIDVLADLDEMTAQIAAKCGAADATGFRRFVGWLGELYRVEMPHFIERNLDSPLQLIGRPAWQLLRLGAFRRLAPKIGSFVQDERLRRLFSFQAMYAGLAPAQALAIYAVITYMDTVAGVHFPAGGMHALPRALAGAASKHGVQLRYGTEVTRIEITRGRATGVITDGGERIAADVVVVNADLPTAYAELLDSRLTPRRVRRLRYSPSCVVVYAGSPVLPQPATHHTISFGGQWERTFDEIITRGVPMTDPSFLLTTPTLTDPSLAPDGRHGHFVLFPTPNLDHRAPIDWAAEGPRYLDSISATLRRRGFAGVIDDAEVLRLHTPADWLAAGLTAGAPFAAAHSFGQTGPFRSPTIDPTIENLVFCGSNTQPGVGVPMVLISGRLAAARVLGH